MTRKTPPVFLKTAAHTEVMRASGPADAGAVPAGANPALSLVPPPPPPCEEGNSAPPSRKSRSRSSAVSGRSGKSSPASGMASAAATVQGREAHGLRQADALIASGEIEKALDHLRGLARELPTSTRTALRMATLLREKHRSSEALEVLRLAVKQAPHYLLSPREALAELCLEVGYWEEAIEHCRIILAVSPRSLLARDILSAACLQRGQIARALGAVDEMIRLDPNDASNHFKRGVLFQQQGCIGAAVQSFERVLEMDPDGEAVDEARAALEVLDNYQIRQIVTLAVEDIPFRVALREDCARAVRRRGYLLSENGLAALSQMRFTDLPDAPPGWRQYCYH